MEGCIYGFDIPGAHQGPDAEKAILEKADVNRTDENGTTGLFLLCLNGNDTL